MVVYTNNKVCLVFAAIGMSIIIDIHLTLLYH